MNTFLFFCTLFTFICCSYCFTTLPPFLKLCSRSDPKFKECVMKSALEALPSIIKGDPEYHIPSFNPFKIDKVSLDASDNVKLYGSNISVIGMELFTLKDMNWDLDKKHVKLKLFTPLLRILGTYNMNGHILILNLKGSGAMNNSHYDNDVEASLKYSLEKKNGLDYMKMENFDINFSMKKVYFHFENILNNPALSEHINEVLNENSKVLLAELFESIKMAIENVMTSIINPFIDKVPYDNIVTP